MVGGATHLAILFVAATLMAGLFALVQNKKRQSYVLLWTLAWIALALKYAVLTAEAQWQNNLRPLDWLMPISDTFGAVTAVLFFCAAQKYARTEVWLRRAVSAVGVLALWAVVHAVGWVQMSPYVGIAFVMFATAWMYWKESRTQESLADLLLAASFIGWGALQLAAGFRGGPTVPSSPTNGLAVLVVQMLTAALLLMAFYEEEKRRTEHNMLALSNLNLATSSYQSGEIQKMLVQAIDRVLGVVRIPCGALFLRYGDTSGPASVVASGLSDRFCATVQDEGLDDHLVALVARLGGLVVFRDLARDSAWEALERQEHFRRFRQLALSQHLKMVVGISLQAKERMFGVLLLGTPDNRRFSPPELRLLLALGHQIGMAVENSYLVQQTARRTEELHILNEIGRALSSTLEIDALFEKIYAEMRRLVDVSNFHIAFYDAKKNEIQFELEVADGVRLPKRSRPAGNHLTEYMVRTRQPMLIRDGFRDEMKKLGLETLRETKCFCGVPLVLYDRAIGVMAVYSHQPGAFDEGHLELMRVLASEAGIAIENARLFREEQEKTRHLTLVNTISRHVIATLNPDEMLATITQQLENGLNYDHFSIATMDYETKELVIQAEGGHKREALGRRLPLTEGLLGQVARTGQMGVVTEMGLRGPRAVLDDSESAIVLPIVMGDQLLGVLTVENKKRHEFGQEEVLLLRTLTDLIAGALHNALTFQKAQEQAITDGLTGVKTHRFFMEALSAEWKRATRAGRAFSLVLIDLDRFKFVNDFYGHLEGDLVLQRVAQILEQNCRRSDVVARYGGDEFVVLMPETTQDQAKQLASKLRAWVASDPLLREKNVTGSFGISSFPVHGATPQELVQVADASMYLSKHQGGNAVSMADRTDGEETKTWKRDVLEAYLGVTLKRLFSTGPEAFQDIYNRLEQFTRSVVSDGPREGTNGKGDGTTMEEMPPAVVDTVTSLAHAIDAKDPYTQGHSQKVSGYAVLLAEGLNLAETEVEQIRLSGLLHDVGKVGIPEAILNKSGPLTVEEWEVMKTHTLLGAKILAPLCGLVGETPLDNGDETNGANGKGTDGLAKSAAALYVHWRQIQLFVKHHHEFWDGSGYPDTLVGKAIPLGARILAIADAYDTITTERTYKKARTADEALAELDRCRGAQFDPELVAVFVRVMKKQLVQVIAVQTPVVAQAPSTR